MKGAGSGKEKGKKRAALGMKAKEPPPTPLGRPWSRTRAWRKKRLTPEGGPRAVPSPGKEGFGGLEENKKDLERMSHRAPASRRQRF